MVNQIQEEKRTIRYNIPVDLEKFLFEYGHSVFIECNKQLANYNLKRLGPKYRQDRRKNRIIAPVIKHMTESLEAMRKHYWLAGGTLLGWYRDCGIIPFTQDVDIAIWAHEYEEKIKSHFLGNRIVRVWSTLGLTNDSFEFRLFNDQFTFDMFLVYKFNSTDQWCGYQVNRVKYRYILTILFSHNFKLDSFIITKKTIITVFYAIVFRRAFESQVHGAV